MATLRGNLPEVYEARMAELFFKRLTMEPLIYPRVANIKPSSKAYEDAFRVSGLGTFQLKPEGTPIAFDDPVQGDRVRIIHDTYALGFRVTMEAREDAQYNVISDMPSDLGDSGRDHQENVFWTVFNNGATTVTALDGVVFFAATHAALKPKNPLVNAQSNILVPGVALSTVGLEAMHQNLRMTLSEEDRQTPMKMTQLLVHPANYYEATRLLESTQAPGSGDNDVNVMNRFGIEIIDVPYLTDEDNYFGGTDKSRHGVVYHNRKELTFSSGKDTVTMDDMFTSHYRASVGVRDWRGWVSSGL